MPDFQIVNNSLKVTWVRRLNDSADASWSTIPLAFLSNVGGRFLFQCSFDLKLLRVNIPIAFYKEVLEAWQKLVLFSPVTKEQILDEIIWNNRFIRIDGFSVYYKQWHEAGVTKISDIFRGDSFLTFNEFLSKFQVKTNFLKYYYRLRPSLKYDDFSALFYISNVNGFVGYVSLLNNETFAVMW